MRCMNLSSIMPTSLELKSTLFSVSAPGEIDVVSLERVGSHSYSSVVSRDANDPLCMEVS